ncbi:MAG: PadR family transcriptional regulator [Verrucomicrobia bacterium]|nr:PadR family transcriptional regulator [Verrucomicrobiota bacterium]
MPPSDRTELLSGTLDLLILRVLSSGPLHGFAIAERIQLVSREVLKVEEGSLYPALYRMAEKGWIKSEWGQSDKGRRAKFYQLTPAGRRQLEAEKELWARLAGAIGAVLRNA